MKIVYPSNQKIERQRESEKRGTYPFLPHSILSFLDFPSFRTLFLWTMSMLSCLRLHQPGINNYPRWKFWTTSHAYNKGKQMGKSTEKEGGEVTNKLFARALVLLHLLKRKFCWIWNDFYCWTGVTWTCLTDFTGECQINYVPFWAAWVWGSSSGLARFIGKFIVINDVEQEE